MKINIVFLALVFNIALISTTHNVYSKTDLEKTTEEPHNFQRDKYNSAPETFKTLEAHSDDTSCMEKVNLEAVKKEEIDELSICILAEIVKMGYPLCNQECLDQLTEDEIYKYLDMRARQTRELLDKELTRRIAEQIKR